MIFELVVQGEPATKARPRVGKGRRIYTPQTTRDAEAAIGWEARAVLGSRVANQVDGLHVEIDFYASTRQRRDLDNMAKLVLDALNGIVWRDDDQIIALTLTKAVDARPRTEVRVFVKEPRGRRCQTCDVDLSARKVTADAVFCSKACYDLAQRKGHYHACAGCGTAVYRQVEKSKARTVYCTPECRRSTWGRCRHCSEPVSRKGLRFCGALCRRAWFEARPVPMNRHIRGHCADCGAPTYNRTAVRCRPCFLDAHAAA